MLHNNYSDLQNGDNILYQKYNYGS